MSDDGCAARTDCGYGHSRCLQYVVLDSRRKTIRHKVSGPEDRVADCGILGAWLEAKTRSR
jgi:hypothetical protein